VLSFRFAGPVVAMSLITACGSTVAVSGNASPSGGDFGLTSGGDSGLTSGGDSGLVDTSTGQVPAATTSGGASAPLGGTPPRAAEQGPNGTSSGTATASETTGNTGASTTGSAAGGARTDPLRVGVLYVDYTKAASAAGYPNDLPNNEAIVRRQVAAANAKGGAAGRKIVPYFRTMDGMSNNYEADAQAVCSSFTQDDKVEVVLSTNGVFNSLSGCLTKAGIAQLTAQQASTYTQKSMLRYPAVVSVAGLSVDRGATSVIENLVQTGWLSKKNKLGVWADGCPESQQTYDSVVQSLSKKYGFAAQKVSFGCPQGFNDIAAISGEASNAVLRMRSDDVDRVMVLSVLEGAALTFFTSQAESQGWRPGYLLSSNALPILWAKNWSSEQKAQMRGFGWYPSADVSKADDNAATRACRELDRSGGGSGTYADPSADLLMISNCDLVQTLLDLTKITGGQGGRAVIDALASLGSSHSSAQAMSGRTSFTAKRHDGGVAGRVFSFASGCGCAQYTGPVRQIP
jgi:hypothetical protein